MTEEQRAEPVSLAEMTRRRDHWRREAEHYKRQAANLKAVVERAESEAENAKRAAGRAQEHAADAGRLADQGWNEARWYAEECGRLRDTMNEMIEQALKEQRAAIAYKIRAELVCCDVYEEGRWLLAAFAPDDEVDRTLAFDRFMDDHSTHTLCYWGEAAARLAEKYGEPEEED